MGMTTVFRDNAVSSLSTLPASFSVLSSSVSSHFHRQCNRFFLSLRGFGFFGSKRFLWFVQNWKRLPYWDTCHNGDQFVDIFQAFMFDGAAWMFFTISSTSSTASGCSIVPLYVQRIPFLNCHRFQLYLMWHLATSMWSNLLSCDQMSSSWQQMTERRFHRPKLPSILSTLNKTNSLSHHPNRSRITSGASTIIS